ncbi:MAG TPA: AAA family ATPase [Oscillospiraceae bacterium]|nr:AAA family ATPase [Oscillospiraceae bacterium]
MTTKYTWTPFYVEFADKLLPYKNNRNEMIRKIARAFESIPMKLPKLDCDEYDIPTDMDPFSVFALFNKSLTDENRIKILQALKVEFDVISDVPRDFYAIPVLNPINATFYRFTGERGDNDIDNLWSLFEVALAYSHEKSESNRRDFAKYFDVCLTYKGVKWNITMSLFWIRPFTYLGLDGRNRSMLNDPRTTTAEFNRKWKDFSGVPPSGEEYLAICNELQVLMDDDTLEYDDFLDFSFNAWRKTIEQETDPLKVKSALKYWYISPGSDGEKWDLFKEKGQVAIGWRALGDLRQYKTKEDMRQALQEEHKNKKSHTNSVHACWQFVHEMQIGDIVIAKAGRSQLLGKGIVTSDYRYQPDEIDSYKNIRQVTWTHLEEHETPKPSPLKTLTEITNQTKLVEAINELYLDGDDPIEAEGEYESYTEENFLNQVYLDKEEYYILRGLLKNKKNLILQGPPGVGKTFIAKRLAYSILGSKDTGRVKMIQFHQSYSYEDFVMGYRPSQNGFVLEEGPFYKFCKEAEKDDPDTPYFFIIDEINRGNLSKIFGELFLLMENDKRGIEVQLLYSNELFTIPANVYIIGMMNTADRSLAIMDYALRRRFAFYTLEPAFNNDTFKRDLINKDNGKLNRLVDNVQKLNDVIAKDDTLGPDFLIGHSYFCNAAVVTDSWVRGVIDYELIPLLREYWFDEPEIVDEWSLKLREAL